jgi:hypothetical protein
MPWDGLVELTAYVWLLMVIYVDALIDPTGWSETGFFNYATRILITDALGINAFPTTTANVIDIDVELSLKHDSVDAIIGLSSLVHDKLSDIVIYEGRVIFKMEFGEWFIGKIS